MTVASREAVYEEVVRTLREHFNISPHRITPQTLLYEELDIDSIDAVDLLVRLKPVVGQQRLRPEVFKSVRTVQDVADALHAALAGEPSPPPAP